MPFWMPPLSLATIAGTIPSHWSVEIVDENIKDIDYDADVDLVGITCFTASSAKGYKIAERFRKRNIIVVLGGSHISVCPLEAINHADCIVIGDADYVFHRLIDDFEDNRLQPIYRSECTADSMNMFAKPRRDLYHTKSFDIVGVTIPATAQAACAIHIGQICKDICNDIVVIFGGADPSARYEYFLQNEFCDFCVIGEGEYTFLEFVQNYKGKKEDICINGLAHMRDGLIYYEPREYIEDLDALPMPAYDLIDMNGY